MLSRKIRVILIPVLLLLLLCVASVLFLNSLIQNPSFQQYLLGQLSRATRFELSTGKIELNLWGGIGITAQDLKARSLVGPERIEAARIRVTLDTGQLIRRRIVPTRIILSRARIELGMEKGKSTAKPGDAPAFKKILAQRLSGFPLVSLEDARVSIKDFPYELEDLYFSASEIRAPPQGLQVRLQGMIVCKQEKAPFTLQGTVTQGIEAETNPLFEMTLKTGAVPVSWIPWPNSMPVKEGHAEASIKLKGSPDGPISAEGNINAKDFRFLLFENGKKMECFLPRLGLDFESRYSKNNLHVPSLRVNTPDFSLAVSSKLDFQDKSNPRLSLKVESPFMSLKTFKKIFPAPLLPQWIENRLFSIVSGGNVRVDIFSLKGTLNQIQNLDLPENAETLSIRIAWKDLELLKDGGGLPLKKISGELAIEKGALRLSGIKGSFGRSTFEDSTLYIKNLFTDAIMYDISAGGSFYVRDLIRQGEMDLTPVTVRQQLQRFKSASGMLKARVRLLYQDGWDHPRIQKGDFLLKDCAITRKELLFPLVLHKADLRIDEKGWNHFSGTGMWGNSRFQASGSAENSLRNGNAHIVARADLNEIIAHLYQGEQFSVKFNDLVSCDISLFRLYDLWSFQGELDLERVKLDTELFSMDPPGKADKIIFSLDLHPRNKVTLRNFICLLGDSALELSSSYDLKKEELSNFWVATPRLLLEDMGIRFKKRDVRAKGVLTCEAEAHVCFRNPLKTSIKGEIEARDLSFVLSGVPSPIPDCDFRLLFSGQTASILFFKMQVGESPIHIHGDLKGWDGLKGNLTIHTNYLNVSDFIQEVSDFRFKSREPGQSRFVRQSDIRFQVKVHKGRLEKLKYGPFETECLFLAGDLFIERFKLQTPHGILEGNGHVKNGKEPEKFFSTHIKVTKQPVKELIYSLGIEKGPVEGLLTLEADLFIKGREKKELLSSLRGNADILLENGIIKKSPVLLKVLDFLSLQKIFKKRPPDVSKEGFYFEKIKSHIDIDKGVLQTNDLVMKSPVFNAAAKGSVDLPHDRIDFDLATQPLETVDSIVSKIPVIGYILAGKEKSILMYCFKVTGPLSKPEVKYVPLKNLGRSTLGFFKRLFETPGRLYKEIPRSEEDIEKQNTPLSEN